MNSLKQFLKKLTKNEKNKEFLDYNSFRLLYGLFNYLRNLDLEKSLVVGERLGLLGYYMDSHHRKLAIDNVIKALNVSDKEAIDIVKSNFIHYGRMLSEITHWEEYYKNFEDYFITENIEIMEKGLSRKKGAIILTGHIGNWEIAGIGYTRKFGKVNVVVKRVSNKYIDNLIRNIRNKIGINLIDDNNTVFKMMRALRNGGTVVFVFDQHAPGSQGVIVDFFGRKVAAFKVVGMLARKYNIPVIPAYSVRDGNGKFIIHVDEPIPPVVTDDLASDILENTQNYTNYIEKIVRKYPKQWFWVHKRWRFD